jgi:long-chain fatty acid transport protein
MKKSVWISFAAVLLSVSGLWGGGWNNTMMGARALAMGAAFAGLADDPSAVYYNPAGLVFQEQGLNLSIDGFYVWPTHEYITPAGARFQSKFNTSIPQLFLTFQTSERLTLGFGAYIPYAGGGVDWTKDQLGVPFKSNLGVISLTPTIAYKVSEKLSVGLNLNFYYSVLEVNTESSGFGALETEESGTAISAGLGLMVKPSERARIGVSIRGPAKMRLAGKSYITTQVEGFAPLRFKTDSETSFNLPWDVEMGFSYKLSDSFLFTTSAQYTLWSTLDKVNKTIKDVPLIGDIQEVEELNFENILIVRAGMEYALPSGLALRAGVGMDRAASPKKTLCITNIDVDKLTLLGGIGYSTGRMRIDFAFVRAFGKEREKTVTPFGIPMTEKYNLNVSIVGLGVTYSF